jgi:hypothetical protein
MKLAPRLDLKFTAKAGLVLILATAPYAYAQESGNVIYQTQVPVPGPGPVTASGGVAGAVVKGAIAPIKGAPYSATITNESVQTLADGNRIVQSSSGSTARDSQGRTRQDMALPTIGNLSASDAPHLVFIQDPVAEVTYTLNLTDKTAQKIPTPPPPPPLSGAGPEGGATVSVQVGADRGIGPGLGQAMTFHKLVPGEELAQVTSEDLGSQTMEGVIVNGTRTTRTIPAGQMGNDRPITITTEVWTSPDLKTIIYSKRNDPRMGEQTFKLTNLVRAEPDASQFTIPSDFKLVDSPKQVIYHTNR